MVSYLQGRQHQSPPNILSSGMHAPFVGIVDRLQTDVLLIFEQACDRQIPSIHRDQWPQSTYR